MTTPPSSTTATCFLLAVLAFLWLAFGITVAMNAHPSYKDAALVRWTMATMACGAAVILAVLASQLKRRSRLSYWLTVGLLTSMILVGLFDELGLADLVYLVLTLIPLALLIRDRNWYLRTPHAPAQNQRAA